MINLNCIVRGFFQSAYLGYYAFADFARRGLMFEGMKLVTQFAFTEIGLHRVEANVQPGNAGSLAAFWGCGFRREGFRRAVCRCSANGANHERWAACWRMKSCYDSRVVSYPDPQRSYDSSQPPPRGPGFGRPRLWNMTTWLIAINVAVFVVDVLSGGRLTAWGNFSVESAIRHLQLWRFHLLFSFLHADPGHIFFNMLSLYFFGPLVEALARKERQLTSPTT